MIRIILSCAIALLSKVTLASTSLDAVGFFVNSGDSSKAILWLEEKLASDQIQSERSSLNYALGKLLFERGAFARAKQVFANNNVKGDLFRDWSRLYLGRIHRAEKNYSSGKKMLQPLISKSKPIRLQIDGKFELAMIAFERKQYWLARKYLKWVERKKRGDSDYPEIVWNLLLIGRKTNSSSQICRWSKKLYYSYPTYHRVNHWGLRLFTNEVNKKQVGCFATFKEKLRRLKRLHWTGFHSRARDELTALSEKLSEFDFDRLSAELFVLNGQMKEAFQLLVKHYPNYKKNLEFIKRFANVAAKAKEFQLSASLYGKAHNMSIRSRSGRDALFKAAFVSYQGKDYDGAKDRFRLFKKRYPTSGLVRDAQWYLAWLTYLQGNYQQSLEYLDYIVKKVRQRKRLWRQVDLARIHYWRGVMAVKLGQKNTAKQAFESVMQEPLISYYSILSSLRYQSSGLDKVRLPALQDGQTNQKDSNGIIGIAKPSGVEFDDYDPVQAKESEEAIHKMEMDEFDLEEDRETDESALVDSEESERLDSFATLFEDSSHERVIERARKLIHLGFHEQAKWELYEIEKKTKDVEKLKAIAYHYQLIEAYHRSAYIGETHFSEPRKENAISAVSDLWKYTYPKAYINEVEKNQKRFSIDREFIWAIIRAESRYRKDVKSPVGAVGLMQLMPYTARELGYLLGQKIEDFSILEQPEVNILLGTRYLRRLYSQFDQKFTLVAGSYNAGPHRVNGWLHYFGRLSMDEFIEHIPFVETRNYIKKVTRNYFVYTQIYKSNPKNLQWLIEDVKVSPYSLNFYQEDWTPIDKANRVPAESKPNKN